METLTADKALWCERCKAHTNHNTEAHDSLSPSGPCLNVIFLNTWECIMHATLCNQTVPFTRRLVQVKLTPEQIQLLKPEKLGVNCGKEVFETLSECFLQYKL